MRGLSELLAEHAATIKSSRVSLGDIADLRGTRSIGVWLLVLALPMVLPVPVPGISVPVWHSPDDHIGATDPGLPAGMAAGNARPTGDRRADYVMIIGRISPTMRRFERVVRPRLSWLASDWARMPVGLICFVLATIITSPIPLGHVAPGTAICLFALGLMQRDGLVVGLGIVAAALALVLVAAATAGVAHVAQIGRELTVITCDAGGA